jgi:hypothetical protein
MFRTENKEKTGKFTRWNEFYISNMGIMRKCCNGGVGMYLYDEGPGQSGDRVRKLKLEPPTEEQEPTDLLGGREAEALISGICKKGKTITPESSGKSFP